MTNEVNASPLSIAGVLITPLKRIATAGGDVLHGMKATDPGFAGFGEAYFSLVQPGAVKAWKRHRRMTLNLIVPAGSVRFVIFDDRAGSPTLGQFAQIVLSPERYGRLTVPPMLWMGFQGVSSDTAMLLNVASIGHDPTEVDRQPADALSFKWSSDS